MLRLPSNQKPYDFYCSKDPAFVQLADNATDDDKKAHARKWKIARETVNYSGLLIEGQTPTKFVLRPLPGHVYRKIVDLYTGETIGNATLNLMLIRAALLDVSGLGDATVNFESVEGLGKVATVEIPNLLDSIAIELNSEIATEVFARAQGAKERPL